MEMDLRCFPWQRMWVYGMCLVKNENGQLVSRKSGRWLSDRDYCHVEIDRNGKDERKVLHRQPTSYFLFVQPANPLWNPDTAFNARTQFKKITKCLTWEQQNALTNSSHEINLWNLAHYQKGVLWDHQDKSWFVLVTTMPDSQIASVCLNATEAEDRLFPVHHRLKQVRRYPTHKH